MTIGTNTRTVRIFGSGDRFLVIQGGLCEDGDELNASTHPRLADGGYVGTLLLATPREGESLHIHAFYDCTWSFAISPGDADGYPPPAWPIRREWAKDHFHSETVEIDVPRDARIRVVNRILP